MARCKYRTQKVAKNRHLGTIAQHCRAISSQRRHVSTIGKKLVKQQYLLHISPTIWWTWTTSGWDRFGSLGHPSYFQRLPRLGSVTERHVVVGVSQTLGRWTEGTTYVWQGDHHVGHWPTFLVTNFSFQHTNWPLIYEFCGDGTHNLNFICARLANAGISFHRVSVCPSVRLLQVGAQLKRLNVWSRKQRHTIAQGVKDSSFLLPKISVQWMFFFVVFRQTLPVAFRTVWLTATTSCHVVYCTFCISTTHQIGVGIAGTIFLRDSVPRFCPEVIVRPWRLLPHAAAA